MVLLLSGLFHLFSANAPMETVPLTTETYSLMKTASIKGRASALHSLVETPVRLTREGVVSSALVQGQCAWMTAGRHRVTPAVTAFLASTEVLREKDVLVRPHMLLTGTSRTCLKITGLNWLLNNICCFIDINECQGRHNCSQVCVNTEGSYICSCQTGYSLNNDSVTCEGKEWMFK